MDTASGFSAKQGSLVNCLRWSALTSQLKKLSGGVSGGRALGGRRDGCGWKTIYMVLLHIDARLVKHCFSYSQ